MRLGRERPRKAVARDLEGEREAASMRLGRERPRKVVAGAIPPVIALLQ